VTGHRSRHPSRGVACAAASHRGLDGVGADGRVRDRLARSLIDDRAAEADLRADREVGGLGLIVGVAPLRALAALAVAADRLAESRGETPTAAATAVGKPGRGWGGGEAKPLAAGAGLAEELGAGPLLPAHVVPLDVVLRARGVSWARQLSAPAGRASWGGASREIQLSVGRASVGRTCVCVSQAAPCSQRQFVPWVPSAITESSVSKSRMPAPFWYLRVDVERHSDASSYM
jgi:hypothetical protein